MNNCPKQLLTVIIETNLLLHSYVLYLGAAPVLYQSCRQCVTPPLGWSLLGQDSPPQIRVA